MCLVPIAIKRERLLLSPSLTMPTCSGFRSLPSIMPNMQSAHIAKEGTIRKNLHQRWNGHFPPDKNATVTEHSGDVEKFSNAL